jgi:hypothetical protein
MSKSIRSRAWRNAMVGAINAGLAQGCFELQCGTGPTDRQHRIYRFTLGDDIPAIASVADIGFDELSIHVALWPTPRAAEFIHAGWLHRPRTRAHVIGDLHVQGWLERERGKWLQYRPYVIYCRRGCADIVAALAIKPNGFAVRHSKPF